MKRMPGKGSLTLHSITPHLTLHKSVLHVLEGFVPPPADGLLLTGLDQQTARLVSLVLELVVQ